MRSSSGGSSNIGSQLSDGVGGNGEASDKSPPPFGTGGGLPQHPIDQYEISSTQHWVMVGVLMPIVIALYLLLILVCYFLFCKRDPSIWNESDTSHDSQQVNLIFKACKAMQSIFISINHFQLSHMDGSFTPPPSYAIFVGSGESNVIPPSYKMLYPANSIDSQANNLGGEYPSQFIL